MSKPIIAVVGATGAQGGSVVKALLKQGEYQVRGISRNVNSTKAKALATQGVELVTADITDEPSLVKAFQGATAIFAVTNFVEMFHKEGAEKATEAEYLQGVNMARAALQTPTLKHYIWSTLSDSNKISNGKFVIPHVDGKVRVDKFIRSQPELLTKTTFLWVTAYATNLFNPPHQPHLLKSIGTYVYFSPIAPSTPYYVVGDVTVNVGIFARAIISNPSKTLGGKYVFGNVETLPVGDYVQLWGRVTGRRTKFLQVSLKDYKELFPVWGEEVSKIPRFWEEAKEKSWSGEEVIPAADLGVQEELVTLEECFASKDWTALDL